MAKTRKQRKPGDAATGGAAGAGGGPLGDDVGGAIAGDASEIALFLVRVFGPEARDIAAERAERSDQAEDWRRVLAAVEALLDGGAASSGRRAALH